ncbi:DUF7507 domain-containing protein [Candidatus Leptofilum sp.]|uniref:DUF7507 domain-containing protein n=1 Tax=Candidatus Leptofilum sp. TaxID=3241576 RepID=UPI003B5B0C88
MLTLSRSRLMAAATLLLATFIFLTLNVAPAAANPGIDIEKHTNGEDADDPTGPVIPVGDPVLWEYIVTNTGNLDLNNLVVYDDQGVAVSCPQTSLVVGETMICTGNGIAEAGQYANIGCVDVIRNGEVILTDCDPSHYYGEEPPPPPPGGGDGCTPGYWKQDQHFDSWVGYSPSDSFDAIFGVSYGGTLLEGADAKGGKENALARHAVAALLNSTNPDVDYLYSTAEVISMVQDAFASGEFNDTKDLFEEQNEMGCPLN